MRYELHFSENMHFVWESVKLFENTICVVHTHILKIWRLMHPILSLNNVYIIYKIVTNLDVRELFIHHKYSRKHMLFILFTYLNVGNDLNSAFSL